MQNIFQHYSAPKDSRRNNTATMEKARYARLEILNRFIRGEAEAAGINYQSIADMLKLAPELTAGKTSAGAELNPKEKYRYALLSAGNSAAFAFELLNVPSEELTAKVTAMEKGAKLGLTTKPMAEAAQKIREIYPRVAHVLDCAVELINELR